jgi:putative pyoverdin transport system ATP-binding/permease protein
MRVIGFFARNAPYRLLISIAIGVAGGLGSAGLLAAFTNVLKNADRHSSFIWGYILLALCLMLPLTRFASEIILMRLTQREFCGLRMRLSMRITQAALRDVEILGTERLMAAFGEDIPKTMYGLSIVPEVCINLAISIGGLVYLGCLSWRVLLVVLGFLVLGILFNQLPALWAMKFFKVAHQASEALFGHLKDLIGGVKELKLHSLRKTIFLSEILRSTANSRRNSFVAAFDIYSIAASFGQMLVFIAIGLMLFSSIAGRPSTAILAGTVITLLYITQPLQLFMNGLPFLANADVALQRFETLVRQLEKPGVQEQTQEIVERVQFKCEELTLKTVTYAYHSYETRECFFLGPIDMSLKAGELVILAGGNGSGKTTLAKVITGLYPAESGEVLMDGQKITGEQQEFYRQHFSAIFYDSYLFESLLGLEIPDLDSEARKGLARLELGHKVTIKNGVFSTTQLSLGQRKRLALLTSIFEDRPIYVFDEWAANQDRRFREYFYREFLPELKAKGKIILVICHDDHYFDVADRIIKLESGKIIYDGVPSVS